MPVNGVHGPWGHKEEYTKYFAGKKDPSGRQGNPIMASMLKSVDECFGRILDELQSQDIADGTIDAVFNYHPHAGANRAGGVWVRSGDFKLMRWFGNPSTHELYNLRDDISETTDLAAVHPDKVTKLDALIDGFLKETGATYPRPNPAFKPSQAKPAADPLDAWKQRGCTATISDGVLHIQGTGKPGTVFLGPATGRMTAPAEVKLKVRSEIGGTGRIDCLPKGAADDARIFSSPFEFKPGEWREITVALTHSGPIGVLRLYLPATDAAPVEIDQIDIQPAQGRGESWSF